MSEIQFRDDYRYCAENNAIEFQALEDGRELICEIPAAALAPRSHSGSEDGDALAATFQEHREEIQNIAERFIRIGAITRFGRVKIGPVMFAG